MTDKTVDYDGDVDFDDSGSVKRAEIWDAMTDQQRSAINSFWFRDAFESIKPPQYRNRKMYDGMDQTIAQLREFHRLETERAALLVAVLSTNFSDREKGILQLMAWGYSNKQIAEVLYITDQTVKNHITNILCKLGHAESRYEAVRRAFLLGLVTFP